MYRQTFYVGALIRREFRARLAELGVDWQEFKGLLDSTFVVRGTAAQLAAIRSLRVA